MNHRICSLLLLLPAWGQVVLAQAEAQLDAWYTGEAGKYARFYTSKENEAAGTPSTTWSRVAGTQVLPVYAGVHEIHHTDDWVFIKTSGLGFHVMGPWYLDAARTLDFPNFPSNTAVTYRIPRVPTAFNGRVTTSLGHRLLR
jgi:hypothetical protein